MFKGSQKSRHQYGPAMEPSNDQERRNSATSFDFRGELSSDLLNSRNKSKRQHHALWVFNMLSSSALQCDENRRVKGVQDQTSDKKLGRNRSGWRGSDLRAVIIAITALRHKRHWDEQKTNRIRVRVGDMRRSDKRCTRGRSGMYGTIQL